MRHLIGKDILRFHCVFWPALLLAAGYEPPKQLFVHGFLLLDDRKISKSVGNVIDPLDLIDVYGVDPLRFYVLRAVPFGQDGSASLDGVRERYDRELANDLGNLLSRTTAMISKYRDGRIPLAPVPGGGERLAALSAGVAIKLDRFDLTGALEDLWAYVRDLNGYVTAQKPWELAKDEANAAELDDGALHARRRAARRVRGTGAVPAGHRAADPRRARPARGRRVVELRVRAHGRHGRGRAGRAALPSHRSSRSRLIDTHAHLDGADDRRVARPGP